MRQRLGIGALLLSAVAAAAGCGAVGGHNIPPAERLMHPGPGVGGPGPGVLPPHEWTNNQVGYVNDGLMLGGWPSDGAGGVALAGASAMGGGGVVAVSGPYCLDDGSMTGGAIGSQSVQLWFGRPESMHVQWDISGAGDFNSSVMVAPGRSIFESGGIYRIKISNLGEGRPGLELYPSIEIAPPSRRTAAFLAHSAIPIQFTEEDLDQVTAGNFVTKVIYLPDPEFQELAVPGVRTLVSTRLDPGLDPIEEADRRGAILAIIRMGNKDMELPSVGGGDESVIQGHIIGSTASEPQAVPAGYTTPVDTTPATTDYIHDEAVEPASGMDGGLDPYCPPAPLPGDLNGYQGGGGGSFLGQIHQRHANRNMPLGPQTMAMGPGGMPQPLVAGFDLPQYGMPHTGTPIGLPGPPHIPLGTPAGLQSHVMKNWTKMHIPDPTSRVKINVKQRPGLSYPHPASRAWVVEDTIHPHVKYGNHHYGLPASDYQQSAGFGRFGQGLFGHFFHGATGKLSGCPDCQ